MKKFILVVALATLLTTNAFASYRAKVVFNKVEKIEIIADKYYISGDIEVNGEKWSSASSSFVVSKKLVESCISLANTAFIKDSTFGINAKVLTSSKGLDLHALEVFSCSIR